MISCIYNDMFTAAWFVHMANRTAIVLSLSFLIVGMLLGVCVCAWVRVGVHVGVHACGFVGVHACVCVCMWVCACMRVWVCVV